MTATCPKCGKSLKVKDEHAGKRLKCPGCGEAFQASATSAAAPRGVAPSRATSAAAPPKPVRPAAREQGPRIAISTNVILIVVAVGVILALVTLVVLGPVRVNRYWTAHQDKAEGDVRDVIEFAMKCQASRSGSWNPTKGTGSPSVGDLRMLPNVIALSIPASVRFDGFGTGGEFEGTYHFETGEVDAQLKTGGLMLPSGVFLGENGTSVAGGQRGDKTTLRPLKAAPAAGGTLHVTGRVTGVRPAAEIDGKKADVFYPPEVDEDGNVISPPKQSPKPPPA